MTQTKALHSYSISGWTHNAEGKQVSVFVTSDAILAEFDRLSMPVPAYLTQILTNGIRYSKEAINMLSEAMRQLDKIAPGVWIRIGEVRK